MKILIENIKIGESMHSPIHYALGWLEAMERSKPDQIVPVTDIIDLLETIANRERERRYRNE